jgi:hypothetical protein
LLVETSLSPKKIQELSNLMLSYLNKHGKITLGLINLLTDKYSSTNSMPSTPSRHPNLLSSDKMSNGAPRQIRLTTQQLSRYSLYGVCLTNFTLTQSSEPILELGNVANIKMVLFTVLFL